MSKLAPKLAKEIGWHCLPARQAFYRMKGFLAPLACFASMSQSLRWQGYFPGCLLALQLG